VSAYGPDRRLASRSQLAILSPAARRRGPLCPGALLHIRRARWWWFLGVPVGIAVGAIAAVFLRTSGDDALTLHRSEKIDASFTAAMDAPSHGTAAPADGRYLLVAFGYTSCPDICPTTLMAVHRVLETLGQDAARVMPVFVTVDPDRDTHEKLGPYVAGFDPRIRSISDPVVVATVLRTFRARAEKRPFPSGGGYGMDHTAVLYVIGPDRRVLAALPEVNSRLVEEVVGSLRADPGFASR